MPEFEGKERNKMEQCSTSQRLFLEYLFRLSLLKLYSLKSKINPFIIMETSEGAFDLTSTNQLGLALKEISDDSFQLILITNFSKPEFIEQIGNGLIKKNALLNFLDFGRMNKKQKKDSNRYNKILNKL